MASLLSRRRLALILGAGLVMLPPACSDYVLVEPGDEPGTEVRGLQLDRSSFQLDDGDTLQLTVRLLDRKGEPIDTVPAGVTLVWSSSDSAVALPDEKGRVAGEHPGTARIGVTAVTPLGSITSGADGTVLQAAAGVVVAGGDEQTGTVAEALSQPLVARVVDRHGDGVAGRMVHFSATDGGSVSADSVAVDSAGRAATTWTLGTTAGPQYVVARVPGLDTDSIRFSAVALAGPAVALGITPDSAELHAIGDTVVLTASGVDAYGNSVGEAAGDWATTDTAVARVDGSGRVVAVGNGMAWIRAVAGAGGDSARVVVRQRAAMVTVSPAADTIDVGASTTIAAVATDSNGVAMAGPAFAWLSDRPAVARVDSAGVVTGLTEGAATITASLDGAADTATITVVPAAGQAVALSVTPDSVELHAIGDTVVLTASGVDAYGDPVGGVAGDWATTDTAVARVDGSGRVVAVGNGMAWIRAVASVGRDSARVVVRQRAATVMVSPAADTIDVGGTTTLAAAATDSNGVAMASPAFVWLSGKPAVVRVDGAGVVTGLSEGTGSVIVALDGAADTATITVVPAAAPGGDPYEPNDPPAAFDVSAGAALDAYDGADGLPFRTVDDARGRPELQPGDVDAFAFTLSSSQHVAADFLALGSVAPVRLTLVDPVSGEARLDAITVAPGENGGIVANLAGSAAGASFGTYELVVDSGSAALPAPVPYSLELTAGAISGQDYLDGDTGRPLEPNDFSRFPGAAAPDTLPFDAVGELSPGDVDLYRLPLVDGANIYVTNRDDAGMAFLAGVYRRDASGQLVLASPEELYVNAGRTVRTGIGAAPGTEYYLALRGSGRYDLCVTDYDCRGSLLIPGAADGAVGYPGETLADSVAVTVYEGYSGESYGPPAAGVLVRFSAAEGTLSATEIITDADGHAAVAYTLPAGSPHPLQVQAKVTGGDSTTFTILGSRRASDLRFTQVAAGGAHSCGLTDTGEVYCWGDNSSGQLGIGTADIRNVAVPVPVAGGLTFRQITGGEYVTCGVTTGDEAYCWGDGAFVGTDTGNYDAVSPVRIDGGSGFAYVDAGNWSACGITLAGAAYCWGDEYGGALGNGVTAGHSTSPVPVTAGVSFSRVAVGVWAACAVSTDGALWCWGIGSNGQLAVDPGTLQSCLDTFGTYVPCRPVPEASSLAGAYDQVAFGEIHACGIGGTGLSCWGDGWDGEVGTGEYGGYTSPQPVAGTYSDVAAGKDHTCALDTGGSAYCWGYNSNGQLGQDPNTVGDALSPLLISGGLTFTGVAAGQRHTCAVTGAGAIYCWGDGGDGQLGDGSYDSYVGTPRLVGGG